MTSDPSWVTQRLAVATLKHTQVFLRMLELFLGRQLLKTEENQFTNSNLPMRVEPKLPLTARLISYGDFPMSPKPESFDFTTDDAASVPIQLAAQDAYQPDARRFFESCASLPNTQRSSNDTSTEHVVKTGSEQDVDHRTGGVDTFDAIREADYYITLSGTPLQDAVEKIYRGDLTGAMKDIDVSLRVSLLGMNQMDKAQKANLEGDDWAGKYVKDSLSDGVDEIRYGRTEMRLASRLLEEGKGNEAVDAITEVFRNLSSGLLQARDAAKSISNKSAVDSPHQPRLYSGSEYTRGSEHLERSNDSLIKALELLDRGDDKQNVIRNLQRSRRQLNFGVNDLEDGLRLSDESAADTKEKRDGITSALKNNWSIDFAVDLIKKGCSEDAKRVIRDSLENIGKSRIQIAGEPGLRK